MKKMSTITTILLLTVLNTFILSFTEARSQSLFEVNVVGQGDPMLFIHGLYSTGEVWNAAVDYYCERYECYVFTLAGFGDVPATDARPYLKTMRDAIIQYTRKNNLQGAILVGHSMGGFISLWAAAEAPNLFKAVISVDGVPYFPILSMPNLTKERADSIATQIKKGIMSQTREEFIASQKKYLPTMISDSTDVARVLQMALKADPETQAQVLYEMFTTDLREEVSAIEVPVLVLGSWIAYKKYGVTAESARKVYKQQLQNIPNYILKLSDKARHFIFYDQPQWFRNQVDAFLEKIE